jgi:hypothetical protein
MPNPSIPASYVAGSINLPANAVVNLLDLIQQQITPNCPGSATELQIWSDAGNTGSIAVGAAGLLSGPLSATNYAIKLTPTGGPRIYRSTYPGSSTPIGDLQLLATVASVLHVEIQA